MKVRVDHGACQGHARCYAEAPDLYVLDDEGYNRMSPTAVPAELEAAARAGARLCPERAIVVEDD